MTQGSARRAGSTLIELLLVLVLLGTLASLVAAGNEGAHLAESAIEPVRDARRAAIRDARVVTLYREDDDGSIIVSSSYATGLLLTDTLGTGAPESVNELPNAPRY